MQEIQETWVQSFVGKIPRNKKWQSAPVFLPGKFHGQRSPVAYSPWDAETDTTEHLQEQDIQKLKILFLSNERDYQKVGESFEANDEGRTPIKESTKWENCQNTLIALSFGAYSFHV